MKIINEHIPRTIFGVKYNTHAIETDTIIMNCLDYFDTKKQQLEQLKYLKSNPNRYKDIKEVKWLIKP